MNNHASILDIFRVSVLIRIISILTGVILLFGILIHLLEPSTFPTVFDGIWWAIVTVFTVGYGDYVPESLRGKMIAIFLILVGTGFGAFYMVSFATELISRQYSNQQGQTAVSLRQHLIIVGWNERVKLIIEQYKNFHSSKNIVLVDETLPNLPSDYSHLLFVKGCPHHDNMIMKAGIQNARTILITADKEKSESDADLQSILTVLTAKGLNADVHCVVEILTPQQVENAKRAGANEVVEANKLTSYALTSSILFPHAAETLVSLYSQMKIQLLPPQENQSGKHFRQYSQQLMEQDILLLGILRKGERHIHPLHPFELEKDDVLITIKR
ncbi:potassium channel family protein [Ectobacillus panaciterrae]|uniref:potassium channel family protein n=1 Tax=Ectobacillus panaciterrae TaxID=363872 RepID=UPI0004920763|nr:potassium channel family protein [Ectobacillus panaciterrae]